ncbi:hypothetical protein OESDEN_18314, partial [Oesophagostomum dentatum]
LFCLFVVVLSSDKCWRSGEEEEKVSYIKGQPLRRRHEIALDRISKFYSKHKHGESPFKSLQGYVEGVPLKSVVLSTDLKKNEIVEVSKAVYQDTYKRCKQTALLNPEQKL